MRNALSIDLEDWFHAELIRSRVRGGRPERRTPWAVEPVLELLQRHDVQATFFVVGDVLRHHPNLVRRIHDLGHEIACHGWSHRTLWSLEPARFAEELEEFDRDAQGVVPTDEIIGYRAPTFSLDERTAWAVDILRDHGYRYDSSIFPVRNYLYGVDGCPRAPYHPTRAELTTDHANEPFIEFPMTSCQVAGFDAPVSGGFYLRAIPQFILNSLLTRVNAEGRPFVIYYHPWEGDIHTPRVRGLSLMTYWVTYYNAGAALRKLETLLKRFEFAPLREVLGLRDARRAGSQP